MIFFPIFVQKNTLAIPSLLLTLSSSKPLSIALVCGKPGLGKIQSLNQLNGSILLIIDQEDRECLAQYFYCSK